MEDEEMDFYLGRSLKNWAARARLPADGRERLLKRANDPAPHFVLSEFHLVETRRGYIYQQPLFHMGSWMRNSFTLSMAWPVQMESLAHFAI